MLQYSAFGGKQACHFAAAKSPTRAEPAKSAASLETQGSESSLHSKQEANANANTPACKDCVLAYILVVVGEQIMCSSVAMAVPCSQCHFLEVEGASKNKLGDIHVAWCALFVYAATVRVRCYNCIIVSHPCLHPHEKCI